MDYDSEIYANGALESGANQRYQQILQQRSPIENSRQLQGYSTRDFRHNQQVRAGRIWPTTPSHCLYCA